MAKPALPTGTAVYFMSPLWPYVVTTQIQLDSRAPEVIDLKDHTKPDVGEGPETVRSDVRWKAENLPNSTHTLRISVAQGQTFAVVDTIM